MKKNRLVVVLIVGMALSISGLWVARAVLERGHGHAKSSSKKAVYYCPMHPTYTSDRPGDCPICNMKLVKMESEGTMSEGDMSQHEHAGHTMKEAAGVAPKSFTVDELVKMKPGEICLLHKCAHGKCTMLMTEEAARLGKCPDCGMDLGVVIKEMMPQGYAGVQLSAKKQELVGINTAQAKKMPLEQTIRTVGRIASDPELYQAQEEFVQAVQSEKKAQAGGIPEIQEQASKLVESSKIRLKLMGLSDELIAEIETAARPDRSLLYSEAGGKVWLYAPIYEYEIPMVKIGDMIEAEAPAMLGKTFLGVIRSIDSVLDPVTRTVRVRAQLDNSEGLLKPEMYVNAVLSIKLGEVIAVPEEAVFATGERNIIFVVKAGGRFEPREVILGAKAEGQYEIKSGLGEGEEVITSGNFLIDSESRLKGALASMGSGGHQHGQ